MKNLMFRIKLDKLDQEHHIRVQELSELFLFFEIYDNVKCRLALKHITECRLTVHLVDEMCRFK